MHHVPNVIFLRDLTCCLIEIRLKENLKMTKIILFMLWLSLSYSFCTLYGINDMLINTEFSLNTPYEPADIYPNSNTVTISFPEQSDLPTLRICDLLVCGQAFTGDILTPGYSGISMKLISNTPIPGNVSVIMRRPDGQYIHEWINTNSTFSVLPGEWSFCNIPLKRDPYWTTSFNSYKRSPDQIWESDLIDVQCIIIRISAITTNSQSYSISDFKFIGENIITAPANLTPLQRYFTVNTINEMTPDMFIKDTDRDGMSDYTEILCGMDPYNSTSVFMVKLNPNTNQIIISWQGILGKKYNIMRSNNIAISNSFKTLNTNEIICTNTAQILYIDTNANTTLPNFYKIINY